MLWTEIFNFFVMHIFGGYTSTGNIYNGFFSYDNTTANTYIKLTNVKFGTVENLQLPIGNYLSFIATLITIIIIFILCCLFIKKIISLMGKLFSGGTL